VLPRVVVLESWSWSRGASRPVFAGLGLGLAPHGLGLGLGLGLCGLGLGLGLGLATVSWPQDHYIQDFVNCVFFNECRLKSDSDSL
jgi:hypothetical protein